MIEDLRALAAAAVAAAEKAFDAGVDDVVALAKRMCPRDTGALEDSIRREGSGNQVSVTFGSAATESYGDMIHENYESLGGMGPRTAAKQAADPEVQIGSHFLTRAADAVEPKLAAAIEAAVTKAMGG